MTNSISIKLKLTTDEIAHYLSPLMGRPIYKQQAQKSAIIIASIGIVLFVYGASGMDDFAGAIIFFVLFGIPLGVLPSLYMYRLYANPKPQNIANGTFYTRQTGTSEVVLNSAGLIWLKEYGSNSKTVPWAEIKHIHRLEEAWYFVVGGTYVKAFILPIEFFESVQQDDEIRDLCRTYWYGEVDFDSQHAE